MDDSKIITELFKIVTELGARDCSNNSVVSGLTGKSCENLCDDGVILFQKLKGK